MALEISGKITPGVSANSTTEKVYNSISISRNREIAKTSGPLERGKDIATEGAVMKGRVRGILKKLNVGDVDTPVDSVGRAVRSAGQTTRAAMQEYRAAAARPIKAENIKASVSDVGGKMSAVG